MPVEGERSMFYVCAGEAEAVGVSIMDGNLDGRNMGGCFFFCGGPLGFDQANDEDSTRNKIQIELEQVKVGNIEATVLTTGYIQITESILQANGLVP